MDNGSQINNRFVQVVLRIIYTVISIVGLFLALIAIAIIFNTLAQEYLTFPRPVGGDYYNALTYAIHFAKHLPFPPTGWLPFWHGGIQIIEGYPTFAFYLMSPLFMFFEPAHAMELFAIGSLLIFLIISLLLFWEITRSIAFSFILTFILFITEATYYQLFGEGLVVASSSQWLLPLTLFFLYRFFKKNKNTYLLLSAVSTGASLLFHPALGVLCIFIPTFTLLAIYLLQQKAKITQKLLRLFIYTSITLGTGSIGLYSMALQIFSGSGSGACDNPQCWGMYPQHLLRWFTVYAPGITIPLFFLSILIKLIKKQTRHFKFIIGSLVALLLLSLYPLSAYLHYIDNFTSAIFPRRIFWAINFFSLLVAANSYFFLSQSFGKKTSWSLSFVSSLIILFFFFTNPKIIHINTTSLFNYPGTIPAHVEQSIIPKYKSKFSNIAGDLVPEWAAQKAKTEQNFRFDSLNNYVNQWWNVAFTMPATRGYSNSPTGEHATWQYFFQVGTAENKQDMDKELMRNRTLFLLDHYAVGLYEDSARNSSGGTLGYDTSLLVDPSLIAKQESLRELTFYEIAKGVTSPIISPSNGTAVLVVGDDAGYETLNRTLSLTGIASQRLIAIKGPESIDELTKRELTQFPALILYQFKGKNWQNIKNYIEKGGKVFIELTNSYSKTPSDILPVTLRTALVEKRWRPKIIKESDITHNVKTENFSPFTFQGGPWRLLTSSQESVRPWTETLLGYDNYVVLSQGKFEKGIIIISGLNLPFHIATYENTDEVNLFKNIIHSLIDKEEIQTPVFNVLRPSPENIVVKAKNIKGVYFKENFHAGWKAKINGKNTSVHKAGLGFMYIPIPKHLQNQALEVKISFSGSLTTWVLFFVSLSSFAISILFVFVPYPFRIFAKHARHHAKHTFLRRVNHWWDKEG